jgi:DNA polymerase elongation subunit (family B)
MNLPEPIEPKPYAYSTLFIDLETIPSPEKPSLDDIEAPQNYKDPEKILAYKESAVLKEWSKQALHPLKGRIFVIGYAINDSPAQVIYSTDEKEMILELERIMIELKYFKIVGHNFLDFDSAFLYTRGIKYGTAMRSLILNAKQDVEDTIKMFAGISYDKQNRYSMKDICKFLGIPAKTEMDGSMVFDYYRDGRFEEIKNYCKEDVEVLRQVYYKLKGRD